jgi:hypothetical protein
MSDISGQLIKDSYSYILQADTSTGYVYRVNGQVPVNPIFSSGLTVFSAFTYVDGNQSNGYVLTSDGAGRASWAAVSGASVASVTAGTGLSGNSTTGAITLINTAPDKTVTITGGTNIQIISNYPNFGINFTGTTSSSGAYLPLSGGTVTGATIFQNGLTANTISATTYQNIPSQSGTGVSAFSYNQSTGLLTITKNDTNTLTAGTFNYVTATTLSAANVLSVASNGGGSTTTTINAVTGGTYSNGTITLSGTGSVNGNQITGLNALTSTTLYSGDGSLSGNRIVNIDGYTLNFSGSGTTNNLVLSGGSVGIGKFPVYKLDVNGDINIPTTTGSTYGVIKQNGDRILHTYGSNNLFLGNSSGNFTTSGTGSNIGIGFNSLIRITTGSNNTSIGTNSLAYNFSGSRNVAIGRDTLYTNNTGSDNVAIGYKAGYYETGNNRLHIANTDAKTLIYGQFDNDRVGINTTNPTNALSVYSTSDPLQLSNVQTSTDTELLTIDGSGVVHKISSSLVGPFLRNETNSGTTDTITINQSIFNPSDLTVLSTSVFIVDTNADYYILGDLYNNGSIIVNGTLKVGGIIYNYGTITGPGIIE